jgi:hypothetical protein
MPRRRRNSDPTPPEKAVESLKRAYANIKTDEVEKEPKVIKINEDPADSLELEEGEIEDTVEVEEEEKPPKKKRRLTKPKYHNGYTLFQTENWPSGEQFFEEKTRKIREGWKSLPKDTKKTFSERAKALNTKNKILNPNTKPKKERSEKHREYDDFRKKHWNNEDTFEENAKRIAVLWAENKQ